jgi:hypothetical protein
MPSDQEVTTELRKAVYAYLRDHLRVSISKGYRYPQRTTLVVELILDDPSDGKPDVISKEEVDIAEGGS